MRTLLAALSVLLVMAVLAACVESDSPDDAADDDVAAAADPTATPKPAEPTPEPEPTPTLEPEPAETPEAEETPTPESGNGEAVEHVVEIQDPHNFVPDELNIAAGDTVTFVNMGNIIHTSTLDPEIARDPDNAQLPDGAETWDSGDMEPGDEFSVTLDVPGEYTYFCRPHEVLGQIGTITVNGDDVTDDDDDEDVDDPVDDQSDEDDEADDDNGIDDYL
jgi:plastocyanin